MRPDPRHPSPSRSTSRSAQPAPPAAAPRAARAAVSTVFVLNGAGIATWLVRLPEIQQRLGVSTGALGLALLGTTLGAIVTMPIAGALIVRRGSRDMTWAAALSFSLLLPLPSVASSLLLLFGALVLLGIANGALDVAMNAQAVAVERRYQRPIIASFHGLLSLGNAGGALVGGALAARGLAPQVHLVLVAALLGLSSLVAARWLIPAAADATATAPAFARPTRALAALGSVAFCVLLSEGAMAEWSAVYFRTVLGVGAGAAALGFSAFAVAMAGGRLLGDRIAARWGAVAVVRGGGILAGGGVLLVVLGNSLTLALVGCACVGLGLASIFPLVVSAAGRTPGVAAASAIAGVSTMGYTGFLAGPPVLGFVAEALTLRGAFAVLVVLSAVVVVLATSVRRTASPQPASAEAELALEPDG